MTLLLKESLEQRILRIADDLQPEIRRTFLEAVGKLKRMVPLGELTLMLEEGNITGALEALADISLTPEQFAPIKDAIATAAGKTAEFTAAEFGLDFALVNERAVRFAQEQAGRLIQGVDAETRAAVSDIVSRGLREGVAPRQQARAIRDSIGLTRRDANAMDRLWIGMIEDRFARTGRPFLSVVEDKRLSEIMARRIRIALNRRATTIARTETIRAANMGTQLGWDAAQDAGLLPQGVRKVWIATEDRRTCPICAVLDGNTVDMRGDFSIDTEATSFTIEGGDIQVAGTRPMKNPSTTRTPPAHPRCRCTVGLADEIEVSPPARDDVLSDIDNAFQTQEMRTHMSGPLEQFPNLMEHSAPAKTLRAHDLDVDDIPTIERKWNKLINDGELRIDTDQTTISQILDDGRLKSQFEVGSSNGSFNPALRADFEHRYFNLLDDVDLPPTQRPIYGYVGETGKGASTFYGDSTIVLKESVADRSTYFFGDSLATDVGGGASQAIPFRKGQFDFVENVQHNFLGEGAQGVKSDLFDSPSLSKVPAHNGYVESQIWGGVRLDDISEIRLGKRPSVALRTQLDELGVNWSVTK